MNNAQKYFIEHRINRGATMEQACEESLQLVVPEMPFAGTVRVIVSGVAYTVFRGGPDSNPWYNFSASV